MKRGWLLPGDKVVIAYLFVIAVLILIFQSRVVLWWMLLPSHALAIACIALLGKLTQHQDFLPAVAVGSSPRPGASASGALPFWHAALQFVRAWYPAVLIGFAFKELEYLIPRIHPRDFDVELAAIDHWIFGVHPTVWLERVTSAPLTELLQLSYITYYFLPLVLGAVLWRRRCRAEFQFLFFVLVLGFFLSYLGYIAAPALGPRLLPEIQSAQTKPLTGVLLFDSIHKTLNRLEGITRDCFPSGHTEVTLLVLFYARRFHRPTFRLLLPAGGLLILATVYLRYHYVIDVIAGALLALLIIIASQPLYRALSGEASPFQDQPVTV